MVNILTMLAPTTLPSANWGLSIRTAVMLLDNSGREVARATRMLPTNRRPQPVKDARASPYLASWTPKKITATALPKNTSMAKVSPTPARGFSKTSYPAPESKPGFRLRLRTRPGNDGSYDMVAHFGGADPGGPGNGDVRSAVTGVDNLLNGLLYAGRLLGQTQRIAEHHRHAEGGGHRVGDALTGDVRGGAVNRLIESPDFPPRRWARRPGWPRAAAP